MEPWVERIQARGGRVVFARFPSTGEVLAVDEAMRSRREHWDRFAARTAAETLHFQDVPGLAGFDCPDGAHLDRGDTARFHRGAGRRASRAEWFGSG